MDDLFRMFRASKTYIHSSNKQQMVNCKDDLNAEKSTNIIGQNSITTIKIPINSSTSSSYGGDSPLRTIATSTSGRSSIGHLNLSQQHQRSKHQHHHQNQNCRIHI